MNELTGSTLEVERRRVVSEREAAAFMGFSPGHLRRLRYEGRGPNHILMGETKVGYKLGALMDWVDERERMTAAKTAADGK